jgi:hypothetical protein
VLDLVRADLVAGGAVVVPAAGNLTPQGKPRLGPLPSLDSLLADPAVFSRVPTETQHALYAQVAALEATLRAGILALSRDGPASTRNEADRAVRIEEAMVLLGMTKDYRGAVLPSTSSPAARPI